MSSSRAGAFLGALGVLAVPAAAVAAQLLRGATLVGSLYYAVPAAVVLGLLALLVSRRARLAAQRSVFLGRGGSVRAARLLAWLALYIGVTGAIAVGVYWVLRARH